MQNEFCIVADVIRNLRESKGFTQEELAERANVSVSHLSKIETYTRTMGMKTYIKLLDAMDISIKEYFTYISMGKEEMMLKKKIWNLIQECNERETTVLLYVIEGVKKGLKEYQ